MKIRLENVRGYTSEQVHATLLRAMEDRDRSLAHLGERFLRGESSDTYPPHLRVLVEDRQIIAWALGQVWDGMASRGSAS